MGTSSGAYELNHECTSTRTSERFQIFQWSSIKRLQRRFCEA